MPELLPPKVSRLMINEVLQFMFSIWQMWSAVQLQMRGRTSHWQDTSQSFWGCSTQNATHNTDRIRYGTSRVVNAKWHRSNTWGVADSKYEYKQLKWKILPFRTSLCISCRFFAQHSSRLVCS